MTMTTTGHSKWSYHLKRLHDQKLLAERVRPPWRCLLGDRCLMRGSPDGGKVTPGDVTAIVIGNEVGHTECVMVWVNEEADAAIARGVAERTKDATHLAELVERHLAECPGCGDFKPRGALAQHRKACG